VRGPCRHVATAMQMGRYLVPITQKNGGIVMLGDFYEKA
tara:strand:+ start:113 stop:229 length:117 start_codon:yes stop_codon:yes gene_type:complete